ncbi:hypothetical protein HG535_0F04360 [Zygotorulaspora mrakii]|uniref:Uncharacterized protein n=1 Tax=Zygotorulaspora mrakii TaxID=42260 RepID=A0A7H9B6I2_ZYGMR|nr:uncharacterized protein HG535_0F04360 [Zygotorulaspora mrakii]QLG73924.1 hypothetical protein HG535_0F04360 [Zygotorulaspora mrakii]
MWSAVKDGGASHTGKAQKEAVQKMCEHERAPFEPKVRVQRHNSLFIIDYSEIPPQGDSIKTSLTKQKASAITNFKVYIYIDIPTIDYYMDELSDYKLSRFNKKFKLHLLRESIYKCFTNGNGQFWEDLISLNDQLKICTISISSSGSLRYVETVKFLMETCYESLMEYITAGKLEIKFRLEVSPTSHKWFLTFLDKRLISNEIIEFIQTGSYLEFSENASTPFKEYYAQLNSKFTSKHEISGSLESIVIITNLTGVKALLTILSDRPLTSYILQDSIDALHDNGLTTKPSKDNNTDASEEETHLKRESSSLLSFQNSLVTSNKDKSVRIRSLSLNRKLHKSQGFTSDDLMIHKTTSRDISTSNTACAKQTSLDTRNASNFRGESQVNSGTSNINDEQFVSRGDEGDFENIAREGDEEDEEDEEDDEEDDEDDKEKGNDSDDGISFSVPSKLSRSGSSFDVRDSERPASRRGRFRSLSLMDPALHGPFKERGSSLSLEPTEDEPSSFEESKVSNIYVHDGEFEDITSSRKGKKKLNKNLLSRQNSANGLIPPEFYSRISSPSTSASSSNSSLQNLNMAPGTFSKWLGPSESSKDTSPSLENNTNKLFEKKLIDKSYEEHRRQTSINLFSTLMGGLNSNSDKNPLALNFKSNKVIPPEIQILDEEDLLMSGYHNGNGNFTAEETSEDEIRSISTVVGDDNVFGVLDSASSNNLNRKSTGERSLSNSSSKAFAATVDLNLQLYGSNSDDHENKENNQEESVDNGMLRDRPKVKYKKAIQLDLYGDDDLGNMGGWILGGNAR